MTDKGGILRRVGVVLFAIAVASLVIGFVQGIPIPKLLDAIQPIVFLAVAAISGAGAVVAFLRGRQYSGQS